MTAVGSEALKKKVQVNIIFRTSEILNNGLGFC